jgi:hypothetical protein
MTNTDTFTTHFYDFHYLEKELKEKSDKYIAELRSTMQNRVIKAAGSLSEPGALPHEQVLSWIIDIPFINPIAYCEPVGSV